MEIIQVAHAAFGFKGCRCIECYYRFMCWTSKGNCCPLRAVRIVYNEGRIEIEIDERLDKFDSTLLAKIGIGLVDIYENK